MKSMTLRYFGVLAAAVLLVASWSGRAQASASKARCIAAYEEGQRLELRRSLKLAAEQFTLCSAAECPTVVTHECRPLLESVRTATPVLALSILDQAGAPLRNVRIAIDQGAVQAFTGQPLSLDPGEHHFTVEAVGYASASQSVSLTFADRTRIEVRLARALEAPPEAEAETSKSPSRLLALRRARLSSPPQSPAAPSATEGKGAVRTALLLSGSAIGVLGGVGVAYFGLSARRGDHDLSSCSPSCSTQAVADVRRNYLLANTSLAAGIVGLVGTAMVWFIVRPPHVEPRRQSFRTWNVQLGLLSTASTTF